MQNALIVRGLTPGATGQMRVAAARVYGEDLVSDVKSGGDGYFWFCIFPSADEGDWRRLLTQLKTPLHLFNCKAWRSVLDEDTEIV